jgi:hypothetical protein
MKEELLEEEMATELNSQMYFQTNSLLSVVIVKIKKSSK